MSEKRFYRVSKRTLLAIAGCVWLLAGVNVARLGVLSYRCLDAVVWYHPVLSAVVFALFGMMFCKMSFKQKARIHGYQEAFRPFWNFFDLKAYCIMAFMMGGGIWLRSSGLAPVVFIAVFYTGLGLALALAGVVFWVMFFRYPAMSGREGADAAR